MGENFLHRGRCLVKGVLGVGLFCNFFRVGPCLHGQADGYANDGYFAMSMT